MAIRNGTFGSASKYKNVISQQVLAGRIADLAEDHERRREHAVKEILTYVFLMAKFGYVDAGMTTSGATTQYYASVNKNIIKEQRKEAAHCAPAQITYNGRSIQTLLPRAMEEQLAGCFGVTDGLPFIINHSDSVAESSGLITAFVNACNETAQAGKYFKFQHAPEFYPQLESSFNLYKRQALPAFISAIESQKDLRRKATEANKQDYHTDKIAVLEIYYKTLSNAEDCHDTAPGLIPETILQDFRNAKKLQSPGL